MKRFLLVAVACLLSSFSHAQFIGNKVNIYFGAGLGAFHGGEIVEEEKFKAPALYSNYKASKSFSLKGLVDKGFYSFGLGLDYAGASGWNLQEQEDYAGSAIKVFSVSPALQLHNRYKETGRSNRLRGIIEVGPAFGLANLTLVRPLFYIHSERGSFSQPMKSNDPFIGVKGSVGAELTISHGVGFYGIYTLQHNRINSNLYHDKHFTSSQVMVGIIKRAERNKRYFY